MTTNTPGRTLPIATVYPFLSSDYTDIRKGLILRFNPRSNVLRSVPMSSLVCPLYLFGN
jgi:hypothetical protein